MSLEHELSGVLSRLDLPIATRATLLERFADSLDLARAGEGGVALENLCDNLFEFNVRIVPDVRDRLAELCFKYAVGAHRRGLLDKLVISPTGARDG
jgi:hypothetical protein